MFQKQSSDNVWSFMQRRYVTRSRGRFTILVDIATVTTVTVTVKVVNQIVNLGVAVYEGSFSSRLSPALSLYQP